jgi:F0F1-type ATP synthase alpha subunit
MIEFMEAKHGDILKEIKEKGQISDDLEAKIKKALDEFKSIFQPA